jgi:rRNA maturation endonuclease Nob1
MRRRRGCSHKFDLTSHICLECGESDKTLKRYERCRQRWLARQQKDGGKNGK